MQNTAMPPSTSISAALITAISLQGDQQRLNALRGLARQLADCRAAKTPAAPHEPNVEPSSRQQSLASAYAKQRAAAKAHGVDELDLAAYARIGDRDMVICGLAALTNFSTDRMDAFLASDRPDLTLVVCRIHNFAWSTVRLILGLRWQGAHPPDDADSLCDDYHDIPVATAQRFGRFLRLHREAAPSAP